MHTQVTNSKTRLLAIAYSIDWPFQFDLILIHIIVSLSAIVLTMLSKTKISVYTLGEENND